MSKKKETECLQKKLSDWKEQIRLRKHLYSNPKLRIEMIEGFEEAVRSCAKETQDAIDDFKGEIEDQKYNLAQSSDVEMFVIDLDNLNTAIRNLETSLEKLLVGYSKSASAEVKT